MHFELLKNKKIYYIFISCIFILGIFLRILFLINNNVYEDDECRLIISYLDQNWLEAFLPLGDAQSAPPLYIIFQRVIGTIFGYKEYVLKSVSLLISFSSLFMFWKISEKFFKHKLIIILSMLIFSINYKLIYFSASIKQYSTDVLMGLLCIYYLTNIDIKALNKKNIILLILLLIILPLISLPSVFFIGAFFILNIIKISKDKEFYKKFFYIVLPFTITLGLYYIFNLQPSQADMISRYSNTWEIGFAQNGKYFLLSTIVVNLSWFFAPSKMNLFLIIFAIIGIWKSYNEKKDLNLYMIITVGLTILASLLNVYPFYNRVSLFSLVIILLFIFKAFDFMQEKKKIALLIVLFLITFGSIFYNLLNKNERTFPSIPASPKEVTQILKEKYNPETDIIYVNEASASSYLFYASSLGFSNERVYILPNDNEKLTEILKNLDKNKKYWLYVIKDYPRTPCLELYRELIKPYTVEYETVVKKSNLIYFSTKK